MLHKQRGHLLNELRYSLKSIFFLVTPIFVFQHIILILNCKLLAACFKYQFELINLLLITDFSYDLLTIYLLHYLLTK